MALNMTLDSAGRAFIQSWEGYRSETYLDQGGTPTIGWGHTGWYSPGVPVALGQTCTLAQAEAWFTADTAAACAEVNAGVTVPINQHQFDALVDFTYNLGVAAFAYSTLRRDLNEGDIMGAANEFLRWDYCAGEPNIGLENRRKAERALFLTGIVSQPGASA